MPVLKERKTLRTAKSKSRGVVGCKAACDKAHGPGTEEWFACMEACQQKAKAAQA